MLHDKNYCAFYFVYLKQYEQIMVRTIQEHTQFTCKYTFFLFKQQAEKCGHSVSLYLNFLTSKVR